MRRARVLLSALVGLLIGGGLALAPAGRSAEACGAFFHVRALSPEQRPSLAREKVLLIHDAAHARQHFIREVAFRRADQRFGFVVPTPTRPEVAEVATNPFSKLRERFPFRPEPVATIGVGRPYGGGSGEYKGVEVLSVEKIGSFTAFVLAASDAEGLANWLRDNQLRSTPESDRWLEHYVRMGFYYVAMRYDPPAETRANDDSIAAQTIRISFSTPIAYYPYFEPEHSVAREDRRLLELWYVGRDPVIPVARVESGGRASWQRPLKPGKEYRDKRARVEAALADELEDLLPDGELIVQTFQDQKTSRRGYHDVLFAFAEAKTFTPEQLAALEPLLGVLDPGLAPSHDAERR